MIINQCDIQNAKFLTRSHGSGKTDGQEHFDKKLFEILAFGLALGLAWSMILHKDPQVLQKIAFNKATIDE